MLWGLTGTIPQGRLDDLVQAGVVSHSPPPRIAACENVGSTPSIHQAQMYTILEEKSGHYLQTPKQSLGLSQQHLMPHYVGIKNSHGGVVDVENSVIPMEVCVMDTNSACPTFVWKQHADVELEENQVVQQVSL